ncbi:hypothetical protein SUGI_0023930 [Cryptomeria japonica]|nr:hypothetical protein SUGI_0023930 [Cryptomeria japonica]
MTYVARCNGRFIENLEAPEQRQVEHPQQQSILSRGKENDKSKEGKKDGWLPEQPVTTPWAHNFRLKCFQKWMAQGKKNYTIFQAIIPSRTSSLRRVNC